MKIVFALISILIFQNSIAQTLAEKELFKQALAIQGFKVFVYVDSISNPELKEALNVLTEKLTELSKIIPSKQLNLLRKVPIWVEYKLKPDGAMWYHKSKEWVTTNGYPAEIAKCVEICNIKNFLAWQKLNQPFMVLHELAHAYHDRVLGSDNPKILAAYQNALASKKYESVDYNLGGKKRAYALNDADEYFAELTEAYLGENDYYPFNKSQLKNFDSMGYKLMQKIWN
ncbi:MAG: hypothetical protein JWO06_3817 [Bacteroidota bacterium]|nr:hypothetical protein [Bacteroidota bacterium]